MFRLGIDDGVAVHDVSTAPEDFREELSCVCVRSWSAPAGEHDGSNSWRTVHVGEECRVYITFAELVAAQKDGKCVKGLLANGRPAGWLPATCVRACSRVISLDRFDEDGAAEHDAPVAPEDFREGLSCICVRDWTHQETETHSSDSWRAIRAGESLQVYATLAELLDAQRGNHCAKGLPTDSGRPAGWFLAACVEVMDADAAEHDACVPKRRAGDGQ